MNILVLGIGNLLLSDEAVGVRIIEALERRYRFSPQIDILDGGTSGMELMEAMAGRDHLIVADAVLSGQAPGEVAVLRDDEVPALFTRKISPHQLGLSDVLMALRLTGEFPQKLTLVGVEPESLEVNIGLTATVTRALEPALQQIIAALRQSGVTVSEREHDEVCSE
ncbi:MULTISPECIES: HyaD/HybD family hydrogenase maturation endopeptidase [Brenneria]|uniref:HyaD/HybD family hydrogenase maturation endopeptidase n=1 Tax=Brenneria nigrifluens DSM 30175 = ATCC 13028 TaxID=1121120 RepID=A0A2U1UPX3_9GAMM|nr:MULTISPECIES: HyaD/HybD family hydrogenase maturation endopeptidase [Brenneria]EHD20794.1 hydrogenase expression/formation protein [Brenneria sp. EniD312]PWC23706.1 HyaD/HybD family hydrogenase maturation endopeptidase [Brenneria nigrifluens DSM 30175 = ATCC 13028]QCR03966.1 HyaD/HybD family hydrogenase maturation endopeptidase [Brenneria nigrifluens DSM 30175 = ATCC 13028]